jgi:hypothetical protein
LTLGLHAADLILQLTSRTAEGIVHGEQGIGVPLVKHMDTSHVDLAATWKR